MSCCLDFRGLSLSAVFPTVVRRKVRRRPFKSVTVMGRESVTGDTSRSHAVAATATSPVLCSSLVLLLSVETRGKGCIYISSYLPFENFHFRNSNLEFPFENVDLLRSRLRVSIFRIFV